MQLKELSCWNDPGLARALKWYRQVSDNERPAKVLIARRIPAGVSLAAPEEELWEAHFPPPGPRTLPT